MQLVAGINGLDVDGHGGGCCGISHLHEFPELKGMKIKNIGRRRVAWIKKAIKWAVTETIGDFADPAKDKVETHHHLIEVVLTGQQIAEWGKSLEACGFREVFTFLNSNSKNRCHIFYLVTGGSE